MMAIAFLISALVCVAGAAGAAIVQRAAIQRGKGPERPFSPYHCAAIWALTFLFTLALWLVRKM